MDNDKPVGKSNIKKRETNERKTGKIYRICETQM